MIKRPPHVSSAGLSWADNTNKNSEIVSGSRGKRLDNHRVIRVAACV